MSYFNPYESRARPVIRNTETLHGVGIPNARTFEVRSRLRSHYAYAIPNDAAIDTLVDLSPIVEIGAGTGYWAMVIERAGGEVTALDACPAESPDDNGYIGERTYHDVRQGTHHAAKCFPEHTLFLCWPDDFNQETGWSDQALENYLNAGGDTLALVSEGKNGAAGSDRLFELARNQMEESERVALPQYPSLHDDLVFYERT